MRRRLPAILLLALLVAGFWLGHRLASVAPAPAGGAMPGPAKPPVAGKGHPAKEPAAAPAGTGEVAKATAPAGGPGEQVVRFASEDAYRKFLAKLAGNERVRLLGQIDALRTLRVGYQNLAELAALLDGDGEMPENFPVTVPEPVAEAQPGAVGLGRGLLDWLGVSGDHSQWGKGVVVAVLDTGVAEHPTLGGTVRRLDALSFPAGEELNGHGTAVASLIAGGNPLAAGVAPAATVLSVRVAGASGFSDSFTLAAGIILAADTGAQIINISMGSEGNSSVVYDAVRYAQQRGAVIVASAGNQGANQPSYPAAYPGVISVGAVDARGTHMDFSNTGAGLVASAPGYQVNAAWPGEQLIGFSGTSASAPIVSGALAAVMSQGQGTMLTAEQAAAALLGNLDDTGAPGADPYYGGGLIDVGRTLRRNQVGVVDAAVAGVTATSNGLLVTVQNRGTTTLVNTGVNVDLGGASHAMNVTSLAPGAVYSFQVPYAPAPGSTTHITTSVQAAARDAFPTNNQRTDVLHAP